MEMTVDDIIRIVGKTFEDYLAGVYTTVEMKRRVKMIVDLIPDNTETK